MDKKKYLFCITKERRFLPIKEEPIEEKAKRLSELLDENRPAIMGLSQKELCEKLYQSIKELEALYDEFDRLTDDIMNMPEDELPFT